MIFFAEENHPDTKFLQVLCLTFADFGCLLFPLCFLFLLVGLWSDFLLLLLLLLFISHGMYPPDLYNTEICIEGLAYP